jgi:hypothetical protein
MRLRAGLEVFVLVRPFFFFAGQIDRALESAKALAKVFFVNIEQLVEIRDLEDLPKVL